MRRVLRRTPATVVVVLGALASACASTSGDHRSTLQQKVGQQGGVGSSQLRLRLYELPPQLDGVVETSADRIRAESSDPAVRRRALLWKADGIPAIYSAALRPDPLAGALDLWALLFQMQDYYTTGAGKDAFGAQQAIAREAVQKMLALSDAVGQSLSVDRESYARQQAQVEKFAHTHPIQGPFSSRETILADLAQFADPGSIGVLIGVGEVTETITDISLRLNEYVTLLPKVARWQAEIAAEAVTGRSDLRDTLDQVDAIGDMARRVDALLADLPAAVRQAGGPVGELLDRQRVELLAAVDNERSNLTGFVTSERQAALSAVSEERRAALEGVGRERAAALSGVDGIAKRSLEDATVRVRGVVDYVFVRALILVAVAAVLFALAYRFAKGPRPVVGSAG
jgi:hypothetical protein